MKAKSDEVCGFLALDFCDRDISFQSNQHTQCISVLPEAVYVVAIVQHCCSLTTRVTI